MNSQKGKASIPTVAISAVALVACVGAGYAIAQNSGDRDPQPAAAAEPSEASESSTSTSVPTSPSSSSPEPSSAPEEPTKITVEPTREPALTSPTKVGIAHSDAGGGSAANSSDSEESPTYTRPPVSVTSTTVPLPAEVQEAQREQEAQQAQAGALIGRDTDDDTDPEADTDTAADADERDSRGDLPARNVSQAGDRHESAPAAGAGDEEGAAPEDTEQPDETQATEQEQPATESAPAPEREVDPVPAPVQEEVEPEPVSAAEIDEDLRSALAPGASDGQIAAAFESGPSMISVGRALADGLPLLGGAVQWHLEDVTGTGDEATGQLVVATPVGQHVVPMTWVRHAGRWQISTNTSCALGAALLGGCD